MRPDNKWYFFPNIAGRNSFVNSINALWPNVLYLHGFQANMFKFKRGDQNLIIIETWPHLDRCVFIVSSRVREASWLDGCCQRSSLVWGSHGLPWELSLRLVLGSSVLQSPSTARICKPSTALCWHRPWEKLGMLEYHWKFQPWHHMYDVCQQKELYFAGRESAKFNLPLFIVELLWTALVTRHDFNRCDRSVRLN